MERFEFQTTQGRVLEATDEAAMMDYARVRTNAVRPCVLVLALTAAFSAGFLLRSDFKTALYTVLVGMILSGFFWIPMLNTKRFRENLRESRARRENLTGTVRAKPMRFVFQDDTCRMLDGKDAEIQVWETVRMLEARESETLFWLPIGDTSVLLLKADMTEGTPEAFRAWVRRHSKRYRYCKVSQRVRRKMQG